MICGIFQLISDKIETMSLNLIKISENRIVYAIVTPFTPIASAPTIVSEFSTILSHSLQFSSVSLSAFLCNCYCDLSLNMVQMNDEIQNF